MTDETTYPTLSSYQDLPREGFRIFRIHDDLVRFTAQHDEGKLTAWILTTNDPNYEGILTYGTHQMEGERVMLYDFRITAPGHVRNNPNLVSVTELRQFYFGEPRDD